ncbi:MAG TPA: hypothetical protein VGD21_08700 [Lysobacter sp.]
MLLTKTIQARIALHERSGGLSALERRALILSDGNRSRDELVNLLGRDVLPLIDRLVRDGYLASAGESCPPAATVTATPRTMTATSPVAMPGPALAVAASASVAAPAARSRRSLAATKMYVIDMLQLQRNADSASLAVSIQASRDPNELIGSVFDALRHIQRSSSTSYGRRVAERLAEIIPEEFLPRLQAMQAAWLAATAA